MEKRKKRVKFSLPPDIIFQILKEIPVKSLLRLRCVSKLCCSIIDDPLFVQSHHTRSHTRPGGISIVLFTSHRDHRNATYCYRLFSVNPEGDSVHRILKFRNLFLKQPQYVNGLILIDGCIWNPSTRECIAILYMSNTKASSDPEYLLGFEPSTNRHKVLRYIITNTRFHYKILTLGNGPNDNSWRDIDDDFIQYGTRFHRGSDCCCIGGVIYYLNIGNSVELVAFEVGREKFSFVPLPEGTSGGNLIEVGQRLALVDFDVTTIWILEDCDKQMWNKQSLTMTLGGRPLKDDYGWSQLVPFIRLRYYSSIIIFKIGHICAIMIWKATS
ncbi:putative F-box protein At1g50870 [Cornus florida]|uniref:putative F-box protein At1g50870 n=1 Tax=Cornus florida TaxID=4283 RepID=UPI002897776E|nr:putative F-box protein At1g50870 [Cornus florida]